MIQAESDILAIRAAQALRILGALEAWCGASERRGFNVAQVGHLWSASLIDGMRSVHSWGSSLPDALAQMAQVARLEVEESRNG